jgi:hypothetical protein
MTINDAFHTTGTGLSDGDELVVDGSTSGTGAAEVFEFGGNVDAVIYRETDTTGNGTFDLSVPIDAQPANWHTQKNQIVVSQSNNQRVRIVVDDPDAAGSGQLFATGLEVNDTQ